MKSFYKINESVFMRLAFTLAEVLIALGVIGVVAALTLPTLISNVTDKIKTNRIKNINAKLVQGTDKLMVLGQINGYETTEDFVKALSEHYKISNWCKGENISKCWPYDKIKIDTEEGEKSVNIADLKNPESFGLNSYDYSYPISFVSGDGVPYIIMYKKNCNIDDGDGRANSTGCISGLYDYNGTRNPNKFISSKDDNTNQTSTDIQFLGEVNRLGDYPAPDGFLNPFINGYKSYKVAGANYYSNGVLNTCENSQYHKYDPRTDDKNTDCNNNYWATAIKYCEDIGMELPTRNVLIEIWCQMNPGKSYTNKNLNTTNECSMYPKNNKLIADINSKANEDDYFWEKTVVGYRSGGAIKFNDGFVYNDYVSTRYKRSVICVGK